MNAVRAHAFSKVCA